MKKASYLLLALMLILNGVLFSKDAVGHISTDDPVPAANQVIPQLSYTMPKNYRRAIVLTSPQKVIRFFESKGIDPADLNSESLTPQLKTELCSICNECCDEFGNVLLEIAAQYRASHFEIYIVKVGDMYWSFYA